MAQSPSSPNPSSSVKDQLQASATQLWSSMKSLEQTMKRPMVSPESSPSNDQQEGQQVSLESVIRVMFGSCTSGIVTPPPAPSPSKSCYISSSTRSRSKSRSTCEPASPTRNEDSLYMKLFSDGHLRAEEAVCHLREQMEQRNNGERSPKSPSPLKGKEVSVPGMFPASFPTAQTRQIDIPNMSQDPPLSVPYSKKSFDDGISIITQYTLDEEAKMYQGENDLLSQVHSDVTQDPIEVVEESWKHIVDPNRGDSQSLRWQQKGMSPLSFTRQGRSHGTINTKQSRGTMGTKSTMSTQTNEMASLWKKEEQKYWHDLVEQDEPTNPASISSKHQRFIQAREMTRRNGRGDRSYENKGKRDGAVTVMHSSIYPGRSATQGDPDRLMEVLVMPPGTEMGEI